MAAWPCRLNTESWWKCGPFVSCLALCAWAQRSPAPDLVLTRTQPPAEGAAGAQANLRNSMARAMVQDGLRQYETLPTKRAPECPCHGV